MAAWAKLRFGGPDWLTGATLTRALLRRGTVLGEPLTQVPGLLVTAQFAIMAFELLSPLVFVAPKRWRYVVVGLFHLFHASVFATISISFIPQQVALLSFVPLERLPDAGRRLPDTGRRLPDTGRRLLHTGRRLLDRSGPIRAEPRRTGQGAGGGPAG